MIDLYHSNIIEHIEKYLDYIDLVHMNMLLIE